MEICRTPETGVNVKYYFKRIGGKWFLIKKENLGD